MVEASKIGRTPEKFKFSQNSLDLIRIFAALQLAYGHLWTRIFPDQPSMVMDIIRFFPRVPIMFFISGFVIAGAWQRDRNIYRYAISRSFRILPGYYVSFLFSFICIMILFSDGVQNNPIQMTTWVAAQLSLLPSWNPQFLREYGMGIVNGALWTIPIEISFYVLAIFIIGRRVNKSVLTTILISLIAISLSINTYAHYFLINSQPDAGTLKKVLTVSPVSFVSWLWLFCLGCLTCIWFEPIVKWTVRHFYALAVILIIVSAIGASIEIPGLLRPYGNNIGLINMLSITGVIFGFAFKFPQAGKIIFKGNDFSYGLYLFHWPVMNMFIELGYSGWSCFFLSLSGAIIMAVLSWFLIEQPMSTVGKIVRDRFVPHRQLTA
jgi:peptidoglycan/LPS O-acetylase OafA/YrhL